jgi:class 3 adenylate cyclase
VTGTVVARRLLWLGFAALLLASALLESLPPIRQVDRSLLDAQWRALRTLRGPGPPSPGADPVVIGIDEATLQGIAEPLALWHRPLGEAFAAIAAAAPRGVVIDIALPERSFDAVLPGSDAALLRGVQALAKTAPLVVAVIAGPDGQPRPPWPALQAVAGPQAFALGLLPLDDDGRVRRLAHSAQPEGAPATLAEAMATRLGRERPPTTGSPLIDYTLGDPFSYLSLQQLLFWQRDGQVDELRRRLGGRIVIVGSVLSFTDRVATPLPLAAWEPALADPPGVLVHGQALRTLLSERAIEPLPLGFPVGLSLLAAWIWWVPAGWRSAAWTAIALVLLAGMSLVLLTWGWYLPVFAPVRSVLLASSTRKALEATLALRERARLRSAFGGYVSPQVLQRLESGELDPSRPDGPRVMAFLFADLRGFTTRGQHEAALDTVVMLNRYYDAIIVPIHARGGMVDNFRGDGIMVVFGAPQPLEEPARAAVLAAGGMVRALRRLNEALIREGRPALEMGIGIATGEAVAAQIGSRQRHDYTAIGDAVNVAARLQDQCRPHGVAAVASQEVAASLRPEDAEVSDLGEIVLRGHTAVRACALGWAGSEEA